MCPSPARDAWADRILQFPRPSSNFSLRIGHVVPEGAIAPSSRRGYVVVLTVLLLLFCLRVIAQMLQAWSLTPFFPPFEAWESGAVPYPLLVVSQVVIIAVCTRVIWRLHTGVAVPSLKTGKVLLVIGGIYWGLMCSRLIIGLTVATDHFWFSARLPTVFHFVLAGFVLVYGWFHYTASDAVNPRSLGRMA